MKTLLTLTVNGEERELFVPVHKTLLEVLREDLELTGTKHGCELGECGTCTVLVDGEPVLSCLALPIECQGRQIKTVEGMASGSQLHPLQQAFAELGAAQCGYCTPGILLTAEALLAGNPAPTRDEVRRSPGGQPLPLHRLHEDPRRRGAGRSHAMKLPVRARRRFTKDPRHDQASPSSASPLPKIDAWAKVAGETKYADDLILPRMAHGKLLQKPASARPHHAHRHDARRGAARRLRRDHRPGLCRA